MLLHSAQGDNLRISSLSPEPPCRWQGDRLPASSSPPLPSVPKAPPPPHRGRLRVGSLRGTSRPAGPCSPSSAQRPQGRRGWGHKGSAAPQRSQGREGGAPRASSGVKPSPTLSRPLHGYSGNLHRGLTLEPGDKLLPDPRAAQTRSTDPAPEPSCHTELCPGDFLDRSPKGGDPRDADLPSATRSLVTVI